MRHWLFECIDENSQCEGEEFIVGADNYPEARAIAEEWFGEVVFHDELTDEEAEISGLDEY